jgi:hypothetical protein
VNEKTLATLNRSKILPQGGKLFVHDNITSQRPAQGDDVREFEFEGKIFTPGKGTFKTDKQGLQNLAKASRLMALGNTLRYIRFLDDFPYFPLSDIWDDTVISGFADPKVYVVQTTPKAIERCILMTTDPGDLVMDVTCGSGTSAVVAEQWGRRWITCDTSRVAVTLAKQRLMTSVFDYYELAHPEEGVGSGFRYKTVPHVTLKSIANNEPPAQETLYDQPYIDNSKTRVTGPFTAADPERSRMFKIPNWKLKTRRAFQVSSPRFHRARHRHALQRFAQPARCPSQHRHYAHVCTLARDAPFQRGTRPQTSRVGEKIRRSVQGRFRRHPGIDGAAHSTEARDRVSCS